MANQATTTDLLSFRDFLGIQTASDVPNEKTVW